MTSKLLATFGRFLPNSKPLYPSSTGLGFALSYTPAIAMVGKYFIERKALAYGIALSGSEIFTYCCFLFLSFIPYFPILSSTPSIFFHFPSHLTSFTDFPLLRFEVPLSVLFLSSPSSPISPHLQVVASGPSSWLLLSKCLLSITPGEELCSSWEDLFPTCVSAVL